jgi:hypothetical protein
MDEDNLFEMTLEEMDHGAFAISIVSDPAIQEDFLALSDSKVLLKVQDEDKRILTGAILIPKLPIVRFNRETKEKYHIFFSEETVREMSQRYLKENNQSNVTLEHQVDVANITLIESWIKEDDTHDKSVALGLQAPLGTWFGTMKVDNDEVWEQFIKAGHLKGFSIEAKLNTKKVTEMSVEKNDNSIIGQIKTLLGVDQSIDETIEEVEMSTVTKEEYAELCAKYDSISEKLDALLKAQEAPEVAELATEEVKEEEAVEASAPEVVEEEAIEASPEAVEEVKEEEVEMIAHTDVVAEEVSLKAEKFDAKLTTAQRLMKSFKN